MDTGLLPVLIGGVIVALLLVALSGLRVVYQYERGVIFVLGRLIGAKGPGVFWVPPLISRMRKIDLRIVTVELPPQEGVTRDNVTVGVGAVLFFYVVNPNDAVNNVLDYYKATVQIAQTTLRSVLGQSLLDQVLSNREEINHNVQATMDERTEPWGLKVTAVEIKDVQLPVSMQRAMAKQAEAERVACAGGAPRSADVGGRSPAALDRAGLPAAAVPANDHRGRDREELDAHFPAAAGSRGAPHKTPAPARGRWRVGVRGASHRASHCAGR